MKIIIFAGGTGKRFWPASRKASPKQFLPIIGNKPLVRLRYDILSQGFDPSDIFVSTGERYKQEVLNILPELPIENFIFEPEMRDTGPAVTLAVSYVGSKFPDEILSIQWSDHLIKKPERFIESLKIAESVAKEQNKIILQGVPVRFASPHRGYINMGELFKEYSPDISLMKFNKFVEKPTKEVAQGYLNSGNYVWNVGYWYMTYHQYMSKIKVSKPDFYTKIKTIESQNFTNNSLELFKTLEKVSADYAFAEALLPEDALVIKTEIGWSDVGEWIAFKEALAESEESNVIEGHVYDMNSSDTLVYNTESDKLIATIGLKGMVVVNTKDVLAVFHKDDNNRLKEFLKKLEEEGLDKYL